MKALLRGLSLWVLAVVSASCNPAQPEVALTVDEAIPRIDELNGRAVSVTGYLSNCGGYDCQLYRNKAEADEWDRFVRESRPLGRPAFRMPDYPTLGIGSGTNFHFDSQAAPFLRSYVVITGTITNICRSNGQPSCTDRGPDILPWSIRAGNPPASR